MNFEQFCSNSSKYTTYTSNSSSNSHHDFKSDNLSIRKENTSDFSSVNKKKNKKKGKCSSLGKRKR